MKTKLIGFLIVSFLVSTSQAGRYADDGGWAPPSKSDISQLTGGDGDHYVPIPWGAELPFPWTIVQGVWMAKYGNFESYFSFKVIKDRQTSAGALKQVEVEQIDVNTCQVIATGMGYLQNRVLRAQMTAMTGNVYRVSLRSFREDSLPAMDPIDSQVVVLSIYPIESQGGYHMPIAKKTLGTNVKCTPAPMRQQK